MSADTDHERIAIKAHEIWESEGRPHGRDQSHWDQAKEIIALQDSLGETLLPRDSGADEPDEPGTAAEAYGDMPGLTDQGRDDLVDIDREPEVTKPAHATVSLGGTAGHVARPIRDETPDVDDEEIVTPPPTVAAVTPTPSSPMLGEPAPRAPGTTEPATARPAPDGAKPDAGVQTSTVGNGTPITAKAQQRPAPEPSPVTKGRYGGKR